MLTQDEEPVTRGSTIVSLHENQKPLLLHLGTDSPGAYLLFQNTPTPRISEGELDS